MRPEIEKCLEEKLVEIMDAVPLHERALLAIKAYDAGRRDLAREIGEALCSFIGNTCLRIWRTASGLANN